MLRVLAAVLVLTLWPTAAWTLDRPAQQAPVPPYNWVVPRGQPGFGTALSGGADEALTPSATANSVGTLDGQALVALAPGSFAPPPSATSVTVTVTPLDPRTLAGPPAGLAYRSNAYAISATFLPSGSRAAALASASVALRFVGSADRILFWDGSSWRALPTEIVASDRTASTSVGQLGTYVVAGPTSPGSRKTGHRWLWASVAGGALIILVSVLLLLARRWRPRLGRQALLVSGCV